MLRRRRRTPLGDLELEVLDRLWADGAAEGREMHAAVGAQRGISPNTVHSALERLVRKGLAERSRKGRAYAYRPVVSRRDWLACSFDGLASEVPVALPSGRTGLLSRGRDGPVLRRGLPVRFPRERTRSRCAC